MQKTTNLLRKGKLMLPQVMLLATLFSCSKQDLQEDSANAVQVQQGSLSALSANPNVLFEETFEGTPWSGLDISQQFETTHAFTVVNSPAFEGSKAGRFELRDTDPMNNNGTRAEVSFRAITSLDQWYSYSIYAPSADYQSDNEDEVLSQWHQGGGYSPAISLRARYDKYFLYVRPTTSTVEKIDLGAIPKDRWVTFVYHIKHSSSSDGLIELWMNGVKVVNRSGVNMYDLKYPNLKLGIYKSAWNNENTSNTSKRVLYFDNIKWGNANATYADMTSTGSVNVSEPVPAPTPAPAPAPETSTEDLAGATTPDAGTSTGTTSNINFTLVNSATEQDVITITDGTIIDLSDYRISKMNIRANTASSGSVKFELSGAQSKTYTDVAAPFALHGDNGNGNYYFGNWNPPALGTYTLKATTSNGETATVTFRIQD